MSGEETNIREMDRNPKLTGRESMAPTRVGNGSDNSSPHKFNKKSRWREGGPQSGPRPRGGDYPPPNRRTYNQFTDKRPRTRGYYNDNHREEVTEDLRAEQGSVLRMGSKKTNLNHLLNFSIGHSDVISSDTRFSSSGSYRSGRGRKSGRRSSVRYNKEQFLQANCQFVVKESGDYTVHAVDPDILVDWDLIEQVKIFGNEVPSCPICLYPPVVAKITRCGHIYCWSCILHYLSLSDKKTWRKCPICYEAVHQNDLKSVVALESHSFKIGEEITMKLMRREKTSTFAVPVHQWQQRSSKLYYIGDSVDLCFSKLLLANPDQVQAILDCERTALEVQLAEEGESLEGSYVKAALELLKERQVSVTLARAAKDSVGSKVEELRQQEAKGADSSCGSSFAPLGKDVIEYSSAFSDEETCTETTDTLSPSLHVTQSAPELKSLADVTIESSESEEQSGRSPRSSLELTMNTSPSQTSQTSPAENIDLGKPVQSGTVTIATGDGEKVEVNVEEVAEELVLPSNEDKRDRDTASGGQKRTDSFYFYQSIDGQHVYLHSVNARCLVKEYGSLENSPPQITAKIVELDGITMNEELRARLRYLNHLPLTCEFKVAELALQPPIISKETLAEFQEDIEKRKRQRQRKQRVETKQLKKMQQEEIKKYEGCPEMKLLVTNTPQFPEFSTQIVQSEMPSLLAQTESPVGSVSSDITMPVGSPSSQEVVVGSVGSDDGGQSSMSFAQMLRAGKMKSQPEQSTAHSGSKSQDKSGSMRDSDSENEDRVPVPLYKDSFGDAISAALETYTSAKSEKKPEASAELDSVGGGGKGKKKKKQKKLLFVNTMARAK